MTRSVQMCPMKGSHFFACDVEAECRFWRCFRPILLLVSGIFWHSNNGKSWRRALVQVVACRIPDASQAKACRMATTQKSRTGSCCQEASSFCGFCRGSCLICLDSSVGAERHASCILQEQCFLILRHQRCKTRLTRQLVGNVTGISRAETLTSLFVLEVSGL